MTGKKGLLISILSVSVPVSGIFNAVYASEPEFARSAEEWASLGDNYLEYDEIEELIHEYNPTVQNNQYDYTDFISEYGRTNTDTADRYNSLADDLESSISGGDDASSMISDLQLELQAEQTREQADDSVEDSEIYRLTYEQAEKSLVAAAQSNMITYYKNKTEIVNSRESLELSKKSLEQDKLKLEAGVLTEADILTAEKDLKSSEKSLSELEDENESVRKKLIVMLGWSYDGDPEIGELPEVSTEEIDGRDLDADIKEATENNYTLKINKRKLENAKSETTKKTLQTTIADNEKQISITVSNSYNSLSAAKRSLEQAVMEAETERENLKISESKKQAGMITDYEYAVSENQLKTKENAVETAKLSLLSAYETYMWNIKGLAAAE